MLAFVERTTESAEGLAAERGYHIGVAAVHVDAAPIFVLTDFLFSFFLFIVVV